MRAAPPGKQQLVPLKDEFITLPVWMHHLDCGVHCVNGEVNLLLAALQESDTLQAIPAQDIHSGDLLYPAIAASPDEDWAVFLTIGVDADARRISQALTEPEYLEAWITLPDLAEDSRIVATKKADGYRLNNYRADRIIASFVGSFLFCHQRKMRLSWRDTARTDLPESRV